MMASFVMMMTCKYRYIICHITIVYIKIYTPDFLHKFTIKRLENVVKNVEE